MLASNEINQAIIEAVKRLNAIRDKSVGLEARRREVSTKIGPFAALQTPTPVELASVTEEIQKTNEEWFSESTQYEGLRKQLIDEIYGKLSNSILVAKGFVPPLQTNSDEFLIPAAQWRFLRFDKEMKNVEGAGVTYLAVAVARA
jgi:hypothetical protein